MRTELKQRAARFFQGGDDADFPEEMPLSRGARQPRHHYKNRNSTGGADEAMIEREFDNRTSLIVDPPDGKIPWTPEGRQRQAASVAAGLAVGVAGPEDLSQCSCAARRMACHGLA
jgi:hypothetical protein